MRENASATATAYRSSRIISIGTPSRPRALFTRQTGKVETQPTPSCLRIRLMPVATSIVMDVVSFAWSRDPGQFELDRLLRRAGEMDGPAHRLADAVEAEAGDRCRDRATASAIPSAAVGDDDIGGR